MPKGLCVTKNKNKKNKPVPKKALAASNPSGPEKLGLVLTAGGARGAYQAGVLKRISEITKIKNQPCPFKIITGASAGAINGATIATHSDNFTEGSEFLSNLWLNIKVNEIFKTSVQSFGLLLGTVIRDLALGKVLGGGHAQSLLDATPLESFLSKQLDLSRLDTAIAKGHLYAFAISATNYYSGKSYTFIQGQEGHPIWKKSRRIAFAENLTIKHICASAAIPIIFQPVRVSTGFGNFYFGDGGMRLSTPLSPAIRLGSKRVLAIGIRSQKAADDKWKKESASFGKERFSMKKPPLAQVLGVLLNSIFLDHLDADSEHLHRINNMIETHFLQPKATAKEPLQRIEHLIINPSQDLGEIADRHAHRMPPMVGYVLEGLGSARSESADLASYLLFDPAYTRELVDLGYSDASAKINEIEHFFRPDCT